MQSFKPSLNSVSFSSNRESLIGDIWTKRICFLRHIVSVCISFLRLKRNNCWQLGPLFVEQNDVTPVVKTDKLFEALDKNHDDQISLSEFIQVNLRVGVQSGHHF